MPRRECESCGDEFISAPFAREKCPSCQKYDRAVAPVSMESSHATELESLLKRAKRKWPTKGIVMLLLEAIEHVYEHEHDNARPQYEKINDEELCDMVTEYLATSGA